MMKSKKLLLIDASSFIYRAFHAFPPLTNDTGEPVGAIFGFFTLLRSLLKREKPEACLIALDPPKGSTHRKKIFEKYKAHRIETPELLKLQIPHIIEMLKFSGLKTHMAMDFEADDLIASATSQFYSDYDIIVIASADKDMAQLVEDPKTSLLQEKDSPALDVAGVHAKYGVYPNQIVDYLSLVGDASDNIPGLKGVGKKTAQLLLQHFSSVNDLYLRLDELSSLTLRGKEKVKNLLEQGRTEVELSRQLAHLNFEIPFPFEATELTVIAPAFESLIEFFERFKFSSFLKEAALGIFGGRQFDLEHVSLFSPSTGLEQKAIEQEIILTELSFESFIDKVFALNSLEEKPFLKSVEILSFEEDLSTLFFVYDKYFVILDEKFFKHISTTQQIFLENLLTSVTIIKLTSGLKSLLQRFPNIEMVGELSYIFHLFSPLESQKNVDELWTRFFGDLKLLISFETKSSLLEQDIRFCLQKASKIALLYEVMATKLYDNYPKVLKILYDIELPLIRTLFCMEQHGIAVDSAKLCLLEKSLCQEAESLEKSVYELSGETFNLASSKQVQHVLFDQLGLPSTIKTKKGERSTNEEALFSLADHYPIAALMLKHREVTKLKSTYAQGLLREISKETHRVHTHYQQLVTSTGRLSSTEPNLQNIPVKTSAGRQIRECFIAPQNSLLLSADYSQIELRILAHFSQDKTLIESFKLKKDIHCVTAAKIFSRPIELISSQERRRAKTIVFGLIYGMSAFGLAKELKISRKDAQTYLEQFFEQYPGVKRYLQETKAQALKNGWVETFLGRRWVAPKLKNSKSAFQDVNLRAAINAPIQGTAAELIKIAMIRLHRWIESLGKNSGIKMLLQVHDELIFEIEEPLIEKYRPKIVYEMEHALEISVPLTVNVGIGKNWATAH